MSGRLLYRIIRTPTTRLGSQVTSPQQCIQTPEDIVRKEAVELRGVIFDMDGTLTIPILDFAEMKRRINIPPTSDILVTVSSMSPEHKARSMQIIEEMEEEANNKMRLQPGVLDLLHFLAQHGVDRALMTRNSARSVAVLLERLRHELEANAAQFPLLVRQPVFSEIVTRDFWPCKPHPAPILHVCQQWSTEPLKVVMVGDDKVDMMCGYNAGAVTVLMNSRDVADLHEYTDHTVLSLHELITLLQSEMTVQRAL